MSEFTHDPISGTWAPGLDNDALMPVEAEVAALREQIAELQRSVDNLTVFVQQLMTTEQRLRCPTPHVGSIRGTVPRGQDQSSGSG